MKKFIDDLLGIVVVLGIIGFAVWTMTSALTTSTSVPHCPSNVYTDC